MAQLSKRRWYIVQTYSGYENAVKEDLRRRIESMNMSEYIFKVIVPEKKVVEKRADGKEKEKIKQIYQGYVFVEMIVTDESWFVVRNTPKVTGFLGSSGGGTKPVPLAENEINSILLEIGEIEKPTYQHLLGKLVQIVSGPFNGRQGEVSRVDDDKETVHVDLEMFDRTVPTAVEAKDVALVNKN